MNVLTLALDLTNKCFETKETYLDLGKCGLTDEDFIAGSDLDRALRKCIHLEQLVLSNSWFEWDEENKIWEEQNSLNTLGQNYFTTHLPALEELSNLTRLICCGENNNRWAISDMNFVQGFHKMNRLNVSHNHITELKGLYALKDLQAFDISYNQITELKGLDALKELQSFYISDNQITELKGLDALQKLQLFYISYNQITELKGLDALKELQAFYIFSNQITELKGLDALKELQSFDIFSNQITELKGLDALKELQSFDISANQITELKGLDTLKVLHKFNISENHITELKGLDALQKLQLFYISYNQITELKGLDALKDLQSFDISNNRITELKGLDALKELQSFYISANRITELKGLDALKELQSFDIHSNQITEVKGLDALKELQSFNISYNQITDITPLLKPYLLKKESPLQIVEKVHYETRSGQINVKNNPLKAPPMEIVQQGNDAVLYWCAAQDQGKVVNHETKIILFGNGRGGKTTLSLRLRKNEFVPLTEKDRTHGILIETWNIPKDDLPEKLKQRIAENIGEHDMRSPLAINKPGSFQIHLWDFGGQEYYHATHRLFMSNNLLYLLIWETATNHQYENEKQEQTDYPVSYWQKNINHFSSRNITLCVQNKVKRQANSTDELHYKIEWRDENDQKSIMRFDNDIEVLKEGILEHLTDLSYIGELSPQVYDDIGQALRKVKSTYISYADYKKICEANDSTPSRIMQDDAQKETLIRFLDDTGALVCFRFRKGIEISTLKEYVFTDPVWLTEIIYKILEKDKAEFGLQHLEKIALNDGLDAALWIEIMKHFELVFEIEKKNEKKYVVPQYLPETCINEDAYDMAIAGKEMEHAFTLNYPDFLPKSNFLRLLAKYGKENVSYLYWKKGMLFILNNKTVFAECIITAEIRKIIIRIHNRDETTTKEIFGVLVAIDEADDLQVSVNEKDFVEVKKLTEKVFKGNMEIDTEEGITLPIDEFKILFDTQPGKPTTRQVFISYAHDDIAFKEELQRFLINIERDGLIKIWQDELIIAGDSWDMKIKEAMGRADICILLLSQSLINSSYSHETEFKTIMEKRAAGTTLIIPVLIKECDWKNWKVYPVNVANKLTEDEIKNYSIGTFQFLPVDDKKRVKPINEWRYKEKAWKQVGEAIRKFCTDNKYC